MLSKVLPWETTLWYPGGGGLVRGRRVADDSPAAGAQPECLLWGDFFSKLAPWETTLQYPLEGGLG